MGLLRWFTGAPRPEPVPLNMWPRNPPPLPDMTEDEAWRAVAESVGRGRRPPTDSGGPGAHYGRDAKALAEGRAMGRPEPLDPRVRRAAPTRAEDLAAAQVEATLALAAAVASRFSPGERTAYHDRAKRAAQRLSAVMMKETP